MSSMYQGNLSLLGILITFGSLGLLIVVIVLLDLVFNRSPREETLTPRETKKAETLSPVQETDRMKAAEIFDLTGETALVTGASTGLGRNFAKVLAANGARVVFIEKNSPIMGGLKAADSGSICTRECAFDMTEQFTFQKVFV